MPLADNVITHAWNLGPTSKTAFIVCCRSNRRGPDATSSPRPQWPLPRPGGRRLPGCDPEVPPLVGEDEITGGGSSVGALQKGTWQLPSSRCGTSAQRCQKQLHASNTTLSILTQTRAHRCQNYNQTSPLWQARKASSRV